MANTELTTDCIVQVKVDKYKNALRFIKVDEDDNKLAHVRHTGRDRDIIYTLPIAALIYLSKDYQTYLKGKG